MVYRLILPTWAKDENPSLPKVVEGEFTDEQIQAYNAQGYNIYFLPNYPSIYNKGTIVDGSQIDTFRFVYVDCDLKDGVYKTKGEFVQAIHEFISPTTIIDSGNGCHVYWEVSDLDAMSCLRLCRRLMRKFKTDEAVGQIYQLMRVADTLNTKTKGDFKPCTVLFESDNFYTSEDLDKLLPPISAEDEEYCQQHWNKTYNTNRDDIKVDDQIPDIFKQLVKNNKEVNKIWCGGVDDRSKADYRLGHIMFAQGFTRAEAMSVLVNTGKALERAPVHRVGYAENIVDKIWSYETEQNQEVKFSLSSTVEEILCRHGETLKGTRLPCWSWIDDTDHGFRLGQVIGLVAGAKVGKTVLALNMFHGFVSSSPDMDHFFVALEQPENEIAERWQKMCGDKTHLHKKVHVLSNYNPDGSYRNFSLQEIEEYINQFQMTTKRKVGCVVIDHIGVLKRVSPDGRQSIEDICHRMKSFAISTNTLLVMQSQAPREKAGGGDLELDKDAAYGTVFFESYVDYLITMWQPLIKAYSNSACPTVTAFKFAAIRHKTKNKDRIHEGVRYRMVFDPNSGLLRELLEEEETQFKFFNNVCVNKRKQDRKTEVLEYVSARSTVDAKTDNHQNSRSA